MITIKCPECGEEGPINKFEAEISRSGDDETELVKCAEMDECGHVFHRNAIKSLMSWEPRLGQSRDQQEHYIERYRALETEQELLEDGVEALRREAFRMPWLEDGYERQNTDEERRKFFRTL